ncbi:hypothetical protein DIPPA_11074 [Diplonema papillatum]|nr:hypothetical protein DIPPA_11074 [Diplonema papillatum]
MSSKKKRKLRPNDLASGHTGLTAAEKQQCSEAVARHSEEAAAGGDCPRADPVAQYTDLLVRLGQGGMRRPAVEGLLETAGLDARLGVTVEGLWQVMTVLKQQRAPCEILDLDGDEAFLALGGSLNQPTAGVCPRLLADVGRQFEIDVRELVDVAEKVRSAPDTPAMPCNLQTPTVYSLLHSGGSPGRHRQVFSAFDEADLEAAVCGWRDDELQAALDKLCRASDRRLRAAYFGLWQRSVRTWRVLLPQAPPCTPPVAPLCGERANRKTSSPRCTRSDSVPRQLDSRVSSTNDAEIVEYDRPPAPSNRVESNGGRACAPRGGKEGGSGAAAGDVFELDRARAPAREADAAAGAAAKGKPPNQRHNPRRGQKEDRCTAHAKQGKSHASSRQVAIRKPALPAAGRGASGVPEVLSLPSHNAVERAALCARLRLLCLCVRKHETLVRSQKAAPPAHEVPSLPTICASSAGSVADPPLYFRRGHWKTMWCSRDQRHAPGFIPLSAASPPGSACDRSNQWVDRYWYARKR